MWTQAVFLNKINKVGDVEVNPTQSVTAAARCAVWSLFLVYR